MRTREQVLGSLKDCQDLQYKTCESDDLFEIEVFINQWSERYKVSNFVSSTIKNEEQIPPTLTKYAVILERVG